MRVLGISAFYHDSAAALVEDGEISAAVQLERFTRQKNDAAFPAAAIRYCLESAGVGLDSVDYVGFYDKPLLTFDRLLETYVGFAPRGFGSFLTSIPLWVREKVFQKRMILRELAALECGKVAPDRLLFGFHHHSHAASAFYPSPFEEAAILVMDGVGEWATTTVGVGRGFASGRRKGSRSLPHRHRRRHDRHRGVRRRLDQAHVGDGPRRIPHHQRHCGRPANAVR